MNVRVNVEGSRGMGNIRRGREAGEGCDMRVKMDENWMGGSSTHHVVLNPLPSLDSQ